MKPATFLNPALFLMCSLSINSPLMAQPDDAQQLHDTVLLHDSLFWQAYNVCDVEMMSTFFTGDVEFYHDKNGLTTSLPDLIEATKKGLCGNKNRHLRREAVEGSLKVYPLNNYGAILTGEHVFYIIETGKKERLDGRARFTHVWRYSNDQWKMARILSYDHGPAPFKNTRKEISLPGEVLSRYEGKYQGADTGPMHITKENNVLSLQAGSARFTLHPETETMFFLSERDLQFEFVKDSSKVLKMIVHEHGEVAEIAMRIN